MERAPPIFYRKSPWDGVSSTNFFKSRHACGDRYEKLRGCSHPPHLRPSKGHFDLTKTGNCPRKVSGTQARSMCEWALYHIFPLSVESVVNTERAPACPERLLMMLIKSEEGFFMSRQDSESLSHNHHRWFFPSRWRTEKENFLFPD